MSSRRMRAMPMRARRCPLALMLVLVAAACRTTVTSESVAQPRVWITRYEATAAWELWDRGKCLGYVLRYARSDEPERAFFNVSNRQHQVLGMIDELNRTWRYRPHQAEPDWLGTGTVLEGSRLVLGASPDSDLIQSSLEGLSSDVLFPTDRNPLASRPLTRSSAPQKPR